MTGANDMRDVYPILASSQVLSDVHRESEESTATLTSLSSHSRNELGSHNSTAGKEYDISTSTHWDEDAASPLKGNIFHKYQSYRSRRNSGEEGSDLEFSSDEEGHFMGDSSSRHDLGQQTEDISGTPQQRRRSSRVLMSSPIPRTLSEERFKADIVNKPPPLHPPMDVTEEAPLSIFIGIYLQYVVLIMFGYLRDFFGKRLRSKEYEDLKEKDGYSPLTSDFESFYIRRLYMRIRDCWNRPTKFVPDSIIHLLDRKTTDRNKSFKFTGQVKKCLNLSSYNYLGFAQSHGPCADAVEEAIKRYGVSTAGPSIETGQSEIHGRVEALVAEFVGKEDAIICNMGFATNSCNIPSLVGKGSLIISDELNHSSLVFGSRLSSASILVYKHNDMKDLERLLREVISQGQPRNHRPWKRILVIVEGLYSMEGTIVQLPQMIELRRKYKFYLFIDEAHSIGALGPRGRGVCDLYGIDPSEVDVLMGTFTKSFGASGGYIAGSKELITFLRGTSHSMVYADTMSPAVCQQILTSMEIIMGRGPDKMEGIRRLEAIRDNTLFFYYSLKKRGFIVWGEPGSPVIPLMLFYPSKLATFSHECLKRGLAVVVVGYPATSLVSPRVRFCISASHSREQLADAIEKISQIGDLLQLKISRHRGRIMK